MSNIAIINDNNNFAPSIFTWPFQKNSNSIKKKLQLNVSLQELKRQGFGVPSP